MKNKVQKHSFLLILTFMLGCMLTGCTNFDASAYIKACLDANTKGEFEAYAEITNSSVEEIENIYNQNIETELSYLQGYNMSDEQMEAFRSLFIDMYKSFKYEVGEAVKNDDGSYTVPVTSYKLYIFKDIMSEGEAYLTEYAESEVNAGRTPSQAELEEKAMTFMYDSMKANLDALEYAEPATVNVTVSPSKQDSQTIYTISTTELQSLLQTFIDIENAQ